MIFEAEYDFASLKGGVRGKYVRRYRSGTNLVLLDPDVAKAFPTDRVVNETLRAALQVMHAARPSRKRQGKVLRRPARETSRR
jgi:hypothetical protein